MPAAAAQLYLVAEHAVNACRMNKKKKTQKNINNSPWSCVCRVYIYPSHKQKRKKNQRIFFQLRSHGHHEQDQLCLVVVWVSRILNIGDGMMYMVENKDV